MKIKKLLLFIIIFVIFFLSGCNQSKVTENNSQEELKIDMTITPKPELGIVKGVFLNSETNNPYQGSLYLSKNLTADHPGYPPVISFSFQTNPRAAQDDYGNFLFNNIEPGQYVIVIYQPTGQNFIPDSVTGEPKLFNVEPGEILDLGTLEFP